MEWSKIKNIVILILLVVNALLLVQTVARERQSAQYREDAILGAVEALRRQGYSVADGALEEEGDFSNLVAARDKAAEEKLARSLLGTVEQTEDGIRVSYKGEKGSATFRADGGFRVVFVPGAYDASRGERDLAAKLLAEDGQDWEVLSAGEDAAMLRQRWAGRPIFSCTARVSYEKGSLSAIEGQRLIGVPTQETGRGNVMDAATALIRFMSGMREGGHVFTQVEKLTAGYRAVSSGREQRLESVWRVATDAGGFLMDAVSGEITPE